MPHKILAVDDEPDILDLVEVTLLSEGYVVISAKDGYEAVAVAKSELPDLILLDLSMPGLDGFEVLEALRKDSATASIPIIMLTARAQISDKLRGLSSGAEDYITKPFDLAVLTERVKTALAQSNRPSVSNPLMGALTEWSGEIAQLAHHLDTAAEIQRGLLPMEMPSLSNIDVYGMLESSLNVSGDFYDFIRLDGERVGIVIADVRGKGVPAALMMVMLRTVIRIVAREARTPAEVIKRANDFLAVETEPDLFASMVYGVLDANAQTFSYCNGGHCYPIRVNGNSNAAETLQTGGMLVGIMEASEYEYATVSLDSNDVIVLYTDGVTESESPAGTHFGDEAMKSYVLESHDLTPKLLCDRLRSRLSEFTGAEHRADDVTVVAIRVKA
ncbi:MAG: SpoIIE family protein phosphatase [Candidatus Poribacteria bacterium]|nr:SpoIIE family protein phosphatase [Candidatus Poribacteria bacterium]